MGGELSEVGTTGYQRTRRILRCPHPVHRFLHITGVTVPAHNSRVYGRALW